jgi:hypothetical protein
MAYSMLAVSLILVVMFGSPLIAQSTTAARTSSTDWPMFKFNSPHVGSSPDVVAPPLFVKWSRPVDGSVMSSPAVSGGIVYVTATAHLTVGGQLYAFDTETGALKWSRILDTSDSSPAVSGGIVYVGSDDNSTSPPERSPPAVNLR